MIDLSNNNGNPKLHDWHKIFTVSGQRRAYLKAVEGTGFVDGTFVQMRQDAIAAGLKVGAYYFTHPLDESPKAAASFFLEHLAASPLRRAHDLRPCLDVEAGPASAGVGKGVTDVAAYMAAHTGVDPLIYGSAGFLQDCKFRRAPGPLWLAAYGKDDGHEYPIAPLPHPWTPAGYAAHQFTSRARVAGVHGLCDLSRVIIPSAVDIPLGR